MWLCIQAGAGLAPLARTSHSSSARSTVSELGPAMLAAANISRPTAARLGLSAASLTHFYWPQQGFQLLRLSDVRALPSKGHQSQATDH